MTMSATVPVRRSPMGALMLKDWRGFRVPVIALLVLGIGLYALGLLTTIGREDMNTSESTALLFPKCALIALFISTLVAAALGGMSIAGERADRTALFTAMLPVGRGRIVASKLVVSLIVFTFNAAVHLLIGALGLYVYWRLTGATLSIQELIGRSGLAPLYEPLTLFAATAFCMFGIAWLAGSFTRSAAISACLGIAVTLAAVVWLGYFLDDRAHWLRKAFAGQEYLLFALLEIALAVPSLIAGTLIYRLRTEP